VNVNDVVPALLTFKAGRYVDREIRRSIVIDDRTLSLRIPLYSAVTFNSLTKCFVRFWRRITVELKR